MNERIKELADQAKVTVLTTHGMEDVVDGCFVISPAQLEKFAELIVQECADYIRTNLDSWAAEPLAFCMERDFGVHGDYA